MSEKFIPQNFQPESVSGGRNGNFIMVNKDQDLTNLVKQQIPFIKDLRDDPNHELPNELHRQKLLQERATDIASCIGQVSYGVFLPSYYQKLLEIKTNHPESKDHCALLIGAMSIETITEFIGTVQSVFPMAKCSLIDIDDRLSHLTKEISSFQIMDGLNTSFSDNKFDSIHTNMLLNHLVDNKKRSSGSLPKLFKEVIRTLKPGGKIIMVENNLEGYSINNLGNLLTGIGFNKIRIGPSKRFKYPLDFDRFMRSSGGNHQLMKKGDFIEDDRVLSITAIK